MEGQVDAWIENGRILLGSRKEQDDDHDDDLDDDDLGYYDDGNNGKDHHFDRHRRRGRRHSRHNSTTTIVGSSNSSSSTKSSGRRQNRHNHKYSHNCRNAGLWYALVGAILFIMLNALHSHHVLVEQQQQQQQQQELRMASGTTAHHDDNGSGGTAVAAAGAEAAGAAAVAGGGQQEQRRRRALSKTTTTPLPNVVQGFCRGMTKEEDEEEEEDDPSSLVRRLRRRRMSSKQQQHHHHHDNNFNHTQNEHDHDRDRPIVFLWGIPSTTSPIEQERRKAIRETYLSYFDNVTTNTSDTTANKGHHHRQQHHHHHHQRPSGRTCTLQEWTCHYPQLRDQCQIIYFFFIGANSDDPKAPKERLLLVGGSGGGSGGSVYSKEHDDADTTNDDDSTTDYRSLLMTSQPASQLSSSSSSKQQQQQQEEGEETNECLKLQRVEPGLVCADLQENQFGGKMTTLFRFAALVANAFPPRSIDYIAKVDSDLLLFTPTFLNYVQQRHDEITVAANPRTAGGGTGGGGAEGAVSRRHVYGGVEFPATNCQQNDHHKTNDPQHRRHECPLPLVGPSYMSGELSFMSVDLARYVTSPQCPRSSMTIPHEDVSLSNYVYSYNNHNNNDSIVIVSIDPGRVLRTRDQAADGHVVDFRLQPQLLDRYVFGHSSNRRPATHQIWKVVEEYKSMWNLFLYFHNGQAGGGGGGNTDTFMGRRYPGPWPGEKLDRLARGAVLSRLANK